MEPKFFLMFLGLRPFLYYESLFLFCSVFPLLLLLLCFVFFVYLAYQCLVCAITLLWHPIVSHSVWKNLSNTPSLWLWASSETFFLTTGSQGYFPSCFPEMFYACFLLVSVNKGFMFLMCAVRPGAKFTFSACCGLHSLPVTFLSITLYQWPLTARTNTWPKKLRRRKVYLAHSLMAYSLMAYSLRAQSMVGREEGRVAGAWGNWSHCI